jgi:hypothetical protein
MDTIAWERLLSAWAADVAANGESPAPAGPLSGLGFPGATEKELQEAEARLGCRLPQSYREFLKCSNGLRQPSEFVAARGGDFWSAQEVDWFRVRNREWIDAWTSAGTVDIPDERYFVYGPEQDPCDMRPEYLEHALEISQMGDASIYLLNPEIVGDDGEWEAWFFASWNPGANRYRSFAEMMLAHRDDGLDGF